MPTLVADDISEGFNHLATIAMIHHGKTDREYWEAITALEEYFGMDEEARTKLIKEVDDFVPEERADARPWILIGFLAGLASYSNASTE